MTFHRTEEAASPLNSTIELKCLECQTVFDFGPLQDETQDGLGEAFRAHCETEHPSVAFTGLERQLV